PFNPETKITFALPEGGKVSLIVTNSAGRQIAELADGIYNAGVHNVTFKASELSSGVYFYTLYAPGFKETRKMLLIK
ncbi:MAG TPA: T9SS type A sorting domain-containing protein, partial [Ignavibacteria bacterium]|nr:T9SS type A sorting domain-containing protein [Ignavibacteria bacterium]